MSPEVPEYRRAALGDSQPEPIYRRLVAALVLALGVFMLLQIGG